MPEAELEVGDYVEVYHYRPSNTSAGHFGRIEALGNLGHYVYQLAFPHDPFTFIWWPAALLRKLTPEEAVLHVLSFDVGDADCLDV